MGKRNRRRSAKSGRDSDELVAPSSDYTDARRGHVLTLRGALSPATRREYARALAGQGPAAAGGEREDVWQRAVELLFERLAVRWTIAGAPIERQRELLAAPSRGHPPRSAPGYARCCASIAPSTSPTSRPPEDEATDSAGVCRAAPGAVRAGSAATNRAVAGLSTNSTDLPALTAHRAGAAPPRARRSTDAVLETSHRSERCARGRHRGTGREGRLQRWSTPHDMAYAMARSAAPRGRPADAEPIPCGPCAAPRSSPPSAPPRASPRRWCAWSRPGWTSRG